MKWYITEPIHIVDGINTVRIVQRELGGEAAGITLKWEHAPSITRVTGQVEVPVYTEQFDPETGELLLDADGFPLQIQTGTRMEDVIEQVNYPYLVVESDMLRAATNEEREAIDAAIAGKAAADEAARQAAKNVKLKAIENLFLILCSAIELQQDITKASKLGFEVLPAYLGQAQANAEYLAGVLAILDGYGAVLDAMEITRPADLDGLKELAALINGAAIYHGGVKWWDDCALHPELLGGA